MPHPFEGTPASNEQISILNKEQKALQDSILPMLKELLGGYKGFTTGIENQARKNFTEQVLPSIAERLTGLSGGDQQSSGYQLAYGNAAGNFESQLGSQRDMRGLQLLQFLLGPALQPQYNQIYNPSQPSFAKQFALGAAPVIPQLIGSYFMGGPGAAAASAAGSFSNQANKPQG